MRTDKLFRIGVMIALLIATIFVILSAFTDLSSPGSIQAIRYYNIAIVFLILTVISSLPLWYKKIEAIEAWELQTRGKDPYVILTAVWRAIKPVVDSLIVAMVLAIVFVIIINHFNLIPIDIIENYKAYYTPHNFNYSNFNYSNNSIDYYPNTSIFD